MTHIFLDQVLWNVAIRCRMHDVEYSIENLQIFHILHPIPIFSTHALCTLNPTINTIFLGRNFKNILWNTPYPHHESQTTIPTSFSPYTMEIYIGVHMFTTTFSKQFFHWPLTHPYAIEVMVWAWALCRRTKYGVVHWPWPSTHLYRAHLYNTSFYGNYTMNFQEFIMTLFKYNVLNLYILSYIVHNSKVPISIPLVGACFCSFLVMNFIICTQYKTKFQP